MPLFDPMYRRLARGLIFAVLLVVLAVTGATERAAHGDTISALDMRRDCRGIDVASPVGGEISMDVTRYPNILTCFGAFSAIAQEIASVNDNRHTAESVFLPGVCAFADGNNRIGVKVLVAVFVHFVDEHPEQGGRDFFPVAWSAFKAAWPCPK
jgi:hypothetical protein